MGFRPSEYAFSVPSTVNPAIFPYARCYVAGFEGESRLKPLTELWSKRQPDHQHRLFSNQAGPQEL